MAERAEDLNLPNAVVTRLIKDALPDGINIGKEARTAIARAASVYVIYVTSVASNIAKRESHKTITAQYILDAIEEIEFESFIEPLKETLEAYRKTSKDRKDKKKEETDKKDDTAEEENSNVIAL